MDTVEISTFQTIALRILRDCYIIKKLQTL